MQLEQKQTKETKQGPASTGCPQDFVFPSSPSIQLNVSRLNQVAEHGVAELRLEPSALGRHEAVRVSNGHQVLDAGGEHGERAGVFAAVDQAFQLRGAPDAAYEVDAFARAGVCD